MATLRWMEVPQADVKQVERSYENTKSKVLGGSGV